MKPVRPRPPGQFSQVPMDPADGMPINFARDDRSYGLYLEWLADYLHRPPGEGPTLSLTQAWMRVGTLTMEIVEWAKEHPCLEYPPDNYQPRHSDILHRVELCAILSRVPSHADRRRLLDRFYRELNDEFAK